jgi:hypothetical protein
MAFTSLLLDTSTGSVTSGMGSYISDLSKTIGVDLFEEDIDNVVFRTNEFLCSADFIGSDGPFWYILQMSMALGALFSIIVAGSMSYKMLVKGEPIDVVKIMKVLGISLVMCFWYPSSTNNNGSILDALAFIPNCIGSYTHDLYEAEAVQVSEKYNELMPLIQKRDSMYHKIAPTQKVAKEIILSEIVQDASMQIEDIEQKQEGEQLAQEAADRSIFAGLIIGLDKIVMFLALVIYRIGWWSTIFCQQILLGMLTIFGPIQWAFSVLPKWEGAWAKWITRYLTVHFYGAMLYFVGYFYNLTHSVSVRLYSNIQHLQQTCTKIAIKKSNEGGARAYWQVGIEKMNVFLFRLSSHLSLVWSCFLSNFCPRISSDFGLVIWHEVAMFDIFSNRR